MSQRAVSVSALVHYVKQKLEGDPLIQRVLVEGEISNFSNYRSGHWYFSLKDGSAQIRCVMFASANSRVKFLPKDGDKVLVQADLNVYEARGEMQLIVTAMQAAGLGELYRQYEELKKKLETEGLFALEHKKPLPPYPFSIGLITGKNTAARSDVLTTLQRRWPVACITEYPVLVQGTESAGQIVQALKKADISGHDVLLLVRGGGSIEDLWSFNDEILARTIYALQTPLITGVGHETDFTIADFAADLRAPTPTGAAERCAPEIRDVASRIDQFVVRLNGAVSARMSAERRHIDAIRRYSWFADPQRLVRDPQLRLNDLAAQLDEEIRAVRTVQDGRLRQLTGSLQKALRERLRDTENTIHENRQALQYALNLRRTRENDRLQKNIHLLDAYSPLKVMARGYSIVLKDGTAVRRADMVQKGDEVELLLGRGKAAAVITDTDMEAEHG